MRTELANMDAFVQNPWNWTWVVVAAIAVLIAYLRGQGIGILNRLLGSPDDWVRAVRRLFGRAPLGTYFTILICDLDCDDKERTQTRHVAAAFRGQRGISVARLNRTLRIDSYAPHDEAEPEAEAKGRQWIRENRGDVLIWGEVAEANKTLRLWLLPREGDGTLDSSAYSLEKTELPMNFHADIAAQLVAIALASVRPVTENSGEFIVDILRPAAEKLRRLVVNPPKGLSKIGLANLNHSLAMAAATIGKQAGDNESLIEAVAAYRAALKEWPRGLMPFEWATTQNNLGNALGTLGARESGAAHLEEAVAAFRAALEERTRERVPLQWASTQNNLGAVLRTLGERESGTARLEEAVAAYHAALLEWTRERVPLDWAGTQNNLGIALSKLGERESGTARLKESVAAFQAALEEWTRERVPLDWAMTQNNLGNALSRLGERESGTERLEAAVAAYREALKVRARARVPLDWATTQNNLGTALATLGERESGTVRLSEAMTAFENALEIFSAMNATYYLSIGQPNLEKVKKALVDRTGKK